MRPFHYPGLTLLAVLASLSAPLTATAQVGGQSVGDWNRVSTTHFEFLYPDELTDWTLHMAERMEAVHGAVESMVGFAPEERITVLVDDPGNVSNGSMAPGPILYMWPTPPNPRSMIGENRGWGEILAVHEFAHAAHLTRPTRHPFRRFVTSLIPIPVTRIMRKTPRWVTEGYATYIEGRLTGSGRPHGVWRPAVLRTWALEGSLPTYGAVSGNSTYWGGAMAYLVGSAYLEWLVEREGRGEEVLPDVWARLTARQERSFGGAFTGVFGAPPSELYGRFKVDVTERALAVEEAVEAAGGAVDGELFQRLSWTTGDPAVSPDGERLALVLRSRDAPSRLVVVSTTLDTLTTEQRERREEILERDPEDVAPVERRPRRQKPLATLPSVLGQGYTDPVWMPDGERLLVIRRDLVENERVRPDLFLWEWETGELRRVTEGAAVREAAPSPDGTWAVGTRCLNARCDLIRIDLASGRVTTLVQADLLSPYYHPRVSPDGHTIVASMQTLDGWRLVAFDADGTDRRFVGPDDGAARFDAEFLDDGRLLLTSTRGGIHDIEILDPASGSVRPLTRVLGSAVAPSTGPDGDVFFLSLHSRGWDLRRIGRESAAIPEVFTDPALTPAAPVPPAEGAVFEPADIGEVRPYGLGPRFHTLLPLLHAAEDGVGGGLSVVGSDPIGRLTWLAQGTWSSDEGPAGGSLRLRYRGLRPTVHLEAFGVRDPFGVQVEPILPIDGPGSPATGTRQVSVDGEPGAALGPEEIFYGGLASLELRRIRLGSSQSLRLGGTAAGVADLGADRLAAVGEYRVRLRRGTGDRRLEQGLDLHGAVGSTGSLDWTRWGARGSVGVRSDDRALTVSGSWARTDAPTTSVEAFTVGGAEPLLFDPLVLSQRVPVPALRTGALVGRELRTAEAVLEGFFPVDAFVWAADVPDDGADWLPLAGVRLDQITPPVPRIRLPSIRIRGGLAHVLDGPEQGDWRLWLTLAYAP